MMRRLALLAALALALSLTAAPLPPGAIQVTSVEWKDAPSPPFVKGTKIAALEGDMTKPELFTTRLRIPAGSELPPHWHPNDERVTVLSGKVHVGFGDTIDRENVTTFGAGGFYVTPAKVHHYVLFVEESEIQLTCEGPWAMHRVNP